MTRIGFAYNQKPLPATAAGSSSGGASSPDAVRDALAVGVLADDEEPPSSATAIAAAPVGDDEYAEWDSPATIAAVAAALAGLGEVVHLEATPDFPERLRAERERGLDIVFNMAEGLRGVNRESHVPAILEFFGVPYSGSDPLTLSLCLDKGRTKEMLAYHGVPTAAFTVVRNARDLAALVERVGGRGSGPELGDSTRHRADSRPATRDPLSLPLFVKPVHEGSSKGITERNYCETIEHLEAQVTFLLEAYQQPVLVEEYLPGREFTCAVLGNGDAAQVLPLVGMNFGALPEGALPVYGYEAKWVWDRPDNPLEMFECPARVGDDLQAAIEDVTLRAYHALACRDWARVDVRLGADGAPRVVEINPLPGILPDPADNSCLPKAARAAGLGYDELIQACVLAAAERQGVSLKRSTGRGGRHSDRSSVSRAASHVSDDVPSYAARQG
ncbi:MAG TPA: hypothetical protein VFJ74_06820 [Gemmatimonadaceae bacterium]|nr:hypothetical protein [Gemmatimonadaceae bacterium]